MAMKLSRAGRVPNDQDKSPAPPAPPEQGTAPYCCFCGAQYKNGARVATHPHKISETVTFYTCGSCQANFDHILDSMSSRELLRRMPYSDQVLYAYGIAYATDGQTIGIIPAKVTDYQKENMILIFDQQNLPIYNILEVARKNCDIVDAYRLKNDKDRIEMELESKKKECADLVAKLEKIKNLGMNEE